MMEYLNYEAFKKQLKKDLEDFLEADYEVGFYETLKTNVGLQECISIKKRGQEGMMDTNYSANRIFQEYMNGDKVRNIARRTVFSYKEAERRARNITLDRLRSYEKAKGHIFYRVINADRNEELLKHVLNEKFLDFAIVFCILLEGSEEGISSCMIQNEMFRKWGVERTEIIRNAKKNMTQLFPAKKLFLDEIVEKILEQREMREETRDYFREEICPDTHKIYIVTNRTMINGFSAVFYRDLLKEIAEEFGSDLYVLPSSIHEALVLPVEAGIRSNALLDIVAEVNRECVLPEEYLSDSVYYYDHMQDELRIMGTTKVVVNGHIG